MLADEEAADLSVSFIFSVEEVSDDLLPPESKISLCEGSCVIVVTQKDRTRSISTIRSKVTSGKDTQEIEREIITYLMEKAAKTAGGMLSSLPGARTSFPGN